MTETPRETRVLDAVVSLVDTLLEDFDVVDLLTELTEHCAQLLDVERRRLPARRPARPAAPAGRHHRAGPRVGTVPAAGRRGPVRGVLRHRPTRLGRRPERRGRTVAPVRARRARRRLRLRARRPDARGRHRAGRTRPVRHRSRRAQRRGPPRRADARAHRVRGDPAGTRADAVDRHTAAALRTREPRHRRAGQGAAARNPRHLRRGGLHSAALLCAGQRRASDRRRPAR